MDYKITDVIEEAKKQLSKELGQSEEMIDIIFRKIVYTFIKL
jgi:hypothetical protein